MVGALRAGTVYRSVFKFISPAPHRVIGMKKVPNPTNDEWVNKWINKWTDKVECEQAVSGGWWGGPRGPWKHCVGLYGPETLGVNDRNLSLSRVQSNIGLYNVYGLEAVKGL